MPDPGEPATITTELPIDPKLNAILDYGDANYQQASAAARGDLEAAREAQARVLATLTRVLELVGE